jgi:predicted RNase H-like HicB family nuclease
MVKKVLNYRIIIEPSRYENGDMVYEAYCPKLGVFDYGDSIESVMDSIKDGIELALEQLVKEGEEAPIEDLEKQIISSTSVHAPAGLRLAIG